MIQESNTIDLSGHQKRHGSQAASPFRYPGGKGFLTPFLSEELERRFGGEKPHFAEPYCGGAGAALNLLCDDKVQHLYLNDADVRIYSSWRAIILETDRFIDKMYTMEPTIENWETSVRILHDVKSADYDFDVGFATFFVNRTSRSGVLLGSGPIGGYNQDGTWKIGARYYRESLAKRVEKLGHRRDQIDLTNLDGLAFCKDLSRRNLLEKTLLFIDPPYVKAGGRLYYDGMTVAKHDALAGWLCARNAPHWILTYDDHSLVRENFREMQDRKLEVRYSLSRRRMEKELLYMS